jgi:FAD/FMN-containing dehydrogenase
MSSHIHCHGIANYHQATGIVTVGGGARLGNLGLGIYNQGQRALPHGTFPGVGIGGHYTHGGFGYSSRRWGMYLAFVDPSSPAGRYFGRTLQINVGYT